MQAAGMALPEGLGRVILIALQSLGLLAVPTFLFLSGGFIVFAVRSKPLGAAYKTLAQSLKHIIVPYVLWSIIFYALIFMMDGTTFSATGYIKNLLVGYPLNFIPILVFFYVLSPLVVRVAERYAWQMIALIFIYQLFSLLVLRPGLFGVALPDWARWFTIPGLRLSIALWGLFFPLGVVYSLHSEWIQRTLRSYWAVPALLFVGMYGFVIAHEAGWLGAPLAGLMMPIFGVLLYPFIARDQIPWIKAWEWLGRRAYGLYLSNLVWISLLLIAVRAFAIGLMDKIFLLVPVLIACTILVVGLLMAGIEKLPVRGLRRYVFG